MMVRMWHGRVPTSKKQAYVDYLHRTGLKDYASATGNRGVDLLCREVGQLTEFFTASRWDSIEAIKGFAGADYQRARYYPEDAEFLTEMEPLVKHYEVVYSSTRP